MVIILLLLLPVVVMVVLVGDVAVVVFVVDVIIGVAVALEVVGFANALIVIVLTILRIFCWNLHGTTSGFANQVAFHDDSPAPSGPPISSSSHFENDLISIPKDEYA
jgi:hypothetical protein